MLKKYEENIYLISQIFSPNDATFENDSESDSDSAAGEFSPMGNESLPEEELKSLPEECRSQLSELSKNRQELEQAYQKIFAEQQTLEKFQDEELDTFENSNRDFHQLFHELKQTKMKFGDIDHYVKKAKELSVFADTHPAMSAIMEGQSPKQAQRPFTDSDHIEYEKL